jgi:predicted RNA-binding Zn-ribbon protein involved in translation (DUF1610 family)
MKYCISCGEEMLEHTEYLYNGIYKRIQCPSCGGYGYTEDYILDESEEDQ